MNLDSKLLSEFLDLAAKRLRGEWLLVGGTLLPAVGLNVRATVDIDLVGLGEAEQGQNLELMELAEAIGLPIEAVNSAAAFFLKRAGFKRSDLLPLRKGGKAIIYRPSVGLYWRLKADRMSESDLVDCQHYYHYCIAHGDQISTKELKAHLAAEIKRTKSGAAEKRHRIQVLIDLASV